MPVIDPQGLFDGDRLAACSDKSKLYWPFLYCASNGYARLEVNLNQIRRKCFSGFMTPATDSDIIEVLKEYTENFLVLLYAHKGKQWVQFDTHKKYLPRHKSKKDEESPSPSENELMEFSEGYINWKSAKSLNLQLVRKISENFGKIREKCHGIGIGIGVGEGIGVGVGNPENTKTNFEDEDNGQGEEMKAKKQLPLLCQQLLGVRAETFPDVINQIDARAILTSNGQVVREFEEFAEENKHEEFRGRPLSAFLRSLDSARAAEIKESAEHPVVKAAGREIAYRTNNQVALNPKAKAIIAASVDEEEYTTGDVVEAFFDFFQNMDPSKIAYAGINFAQESSDRLYAVRRRKAEKEQEASAVDSAKERMQREAEEERQARQKAQLAEQALVEDELGD